MVVRRAFRDLALAVLMAFPLAALAHLNPTPKGATFAAADTHPMSASGRIGLLG